jgi:hypothetical protein
MADMGLELGLGLAGRIEPGVVDDLIENRPKT